MQVHYLSSIKKRSAIGLVTAEDYSDTYCEGNRCANLKICTLNLSVIFIAVAGVTLFCIAILIVILEEFRRLAEIYLYCTSDSYRIFMNLTLPAGRTSHFYIEFIYNSISIKMYWSSFKQTICYFNFITWVWYFKTKIVD